VWIGIDPPDDLKTHKLSSEPNPVCSRYHGRILKLGATIQKGGGHLETCRMADLERLHLVVIRFTRILCGQEIRRLLFPNDKETLKVLAFGGLPKLPAQQSATVSQSFVLRGPGDDTSAKEFGYTRINCEYNESAELP
jgi:hypothetical protein